MKLLNSKNIHSIKYIPESKTLVVKFHNSNHLYHYPNISENEYKAFESAKSHGEHFAKHLKHRKNFKIKP